MTGICLPAKPLKQQGGWGLEGWGVSFRNLIPAWILPPLRESNIFFPGTRKQYLSMTLVLTKALVPPMCSHICQGSYNPKGL